MTVRIRDPRHLLNAQLLARALEHFQLVQPHETSGAAVDRLFGPETDTLELPAQFLDLLYRVRSLATHRAHEAFLKGMGGTLFRPELAGLTPADVALLAYLDHRELYNRITALHGYSTRRQYREYQGLAAPERAPLCMDELEELASWLGAGFEERNRSRHCQIYAFELDGLHYFDISHGDLVSRRPAVSEDGGNTKVVAVEFREEDTDRVIFDPSTNRLRISARDDATRLQYQEAFGITLFGQRSWFQRGGTVRLDPLVIRERDAVQLVPGLAEVRLTHFECVQPDGMGERLTHEDILSTLERRRTERSDTYPLFTGDPVVAHFRMRTIDGRQGTVQLRPPNFVSKPRTLGPEAMAFLVHNGYCARPRKPGPG
ncbi:MAG: hypothetical protein EP330_13760 [Deltaproteobacteria bacterium]|nr:MAG: hypothetical protein EP330_13760 [Deltaproteobacteria bacterium]